jgi:hypothetical protein
MADNTSVNTNTGAVGATNVPVAGDDIGGAIHQRVKVEFGTDGTATEVSASNPLPVVQTGTPALPTGAATEATLSTINGKLPSTVAGSQPATLRNAAGTAIGSLALATGLEGLMTAQGATDFYFSTANTTTAQLAAAATFTGAVESIVSAQAVSVILTSDQPGTLVLREYIDAGGTRVSSVRTIAVTAGNPVSRCFVANGNYFALTFQNTGGSTTTTLNINTAFGTLPVVTSLGNSNVALNEVNGSAISLGTAAATAALPVVGCNDLVVGAAASIAALNVDLLTGSASGWYDASAFHSCSVQIVGSAGITAGAIFFEQTNDTTVAAAGNIWPVEEMTGLTPTPNIAAITISASTTRMFCGPVVSRYVRVRVSTAFATANVQAIAVFSQNPYVRPVQTVHQATAANLNVTVGSGTVTTVSTLTTLSNGQAAHAASIAGSPHRIAGRALNANYATLTTGQVADLVTTLAGALIAKPYSIPEQEFVAHDRITNSTTAAQLRALTASNKAYVTGLTINTATLGGTTEFQLRSTPVASTTATIASNTLVMAATYNWKVGDMVYVTASGVTGLTVNTSYYVLTVSGANLTFSATRGGTTLAISGTSVSATLAKVLWRTTLNTTAQPIVSLAWNNPADTGTGLALEAVALSAVTGQIDFSVSGYVAP